MATLTGLPLLQDRYKTFEFRNRTSITKHLQLVGGDSMQVQPGAVGKVQSELVSQLPAFSDFLPVVPSTAELIEAGLIGDASESTAVPTPPTPVVETEKQTGGQPLKSK